MGSRLRWAVEQGSYLFKDLRMQSFCLILVGM